MTRNNKDWTIQKLMSGHSISYLASAVIFTIVTAIATPVALSTELPHDTTPDKKVDDVANSPAATQSWDAKFQSTYVWQSKQPFSAAYSGPNSLSTNYEKSYSFTATGYFGARLWESAEVYLNPELVQGVPMSNLVGLGGLTNGELQKTAGAKPKLYNARLFLRQSVRLDSEREEVSSDFNQLAGSRYKNRVVVTIGNLAVSDIFDANSYAHDPRTQFLNWGLLTHGAYDFAADSRGYSWGGAVEYYDHDWAFRVGRFLQPRQSNGLPLDWRFFVHYGDQLEIEHGYQWGNLPGKIRLLAFRNVIVAGAYRDALSAAAQTGSMPDVGTVRKQQSKYGVGINWEQALSPDVGIFARIAANNGATETYAFAEIDRSLSSGITARGQEWGRPDDVFGAAIAQNGLSAVHRDYVAAGGLGFFVGDGRIRYRAEQIIETYYNINLRKGSALGFGFQRIFNPAYNADRGPVSVSSARLHIEF
jgi:high affinity Mn2+ porin